MAGGAEPRLEVLACDNHLLFVAKPAGVPSVPDASGDPSLLERARAWVRETYDKPGEAFLGVVHRLDRPVSGVMLFARTSKAAERLSAAFAERRARKVYWALTPAPPAGPEGRREGTIEQWLRKDRGRNVVDVASEGAPDARRAETGWRVLEVRPGACLVELVPHTGRSHQLRVAMASLGLPLLGDLKYGADAPLPDRSIALHARSLEVRHPTRPVTVRAVVPPPDGHPWTHDACRRARGAGAAVTEVADGPPGRGEEQHR